MSLPPWQKIATSSSANSIYLLGHYPDWLVAPPETAVVIDRLLAGSPPANLAEELLSGQLARPASPPYGGRAEHLRLERLRECWFHITNKCNLSCSHCLFAAGPTAPGSLTPEQLSAAIDQARGLGCKLFYFTGGEPFIYPDFCKIIGDILAADPSHQVVVLTNGLLLERHLAELGALDTKRLHLQLSVDGLEPRHDAIRGKGTFARLLATIRKVRAAGLKNITLAMAVGRENLVDMAAVVRLAHDEGCANVHFLWHFQRGKGIAAELVPPGELLANLLAAQELAAELGVAIDNIETLRAQVFSSPGTRFDLSNTGWQSLAVGPDGHVYPSPALVGVAQLDCGDLERAGLAEIWRESPVLSEIRAATIAASAYEENPYRFLIGGGDIDHSFIKGGSFAGHDPYVELYNGVARYLISGQGAGYPVADGEILLKMGDVRLDCPDGQAVTMTHCNCVVALGDGHTSVREFYGAAALAPQEDIVNPFAASQDQATYIPEESRKISYGCGSPVTSGAPAPGETVVDLGSGSGVECFMAAQAVGESGRVYGIDMTEEMLALARESKEQVVAELGFDNVEFKEGLLEEIPLAADTVDLVISNCVINLSPDKRRVFLEVLRVLQPGGRLVVSDIVTDGLVPAEIKNNEVLRGECLGGAMAQEELLAMLRATGFSHMELLQRLPYREEGGVQFYSLTFRAWKPGPAEEVEVIYRGPLAALTCADGTLLVKGRRQRIASRVVSAALGDSLFVVDDEGTVTNMVMSSSCCLDQAEGEDCCACPPETVGAGDEGEAKLRDDCMVCGAPLTYLTREVEASCHYCGRQVAANGCCEEGHFVCDQCHQGEGLAIIRKLCLQSREKDMVALLAEIRQQPAINTHGPEHHALLPGVILATARNRGLALSDDEILTGISRGSKVPGGACGFMGICGAATGVGIAMAVLAAATPLTPKARQQAQGATARVLTRLAEIRAGRCCQRECWLALQEVAQISQEMLEAPLLAEAPLHCQQYGQNRECVRKKCPLWASRDQGAGTLKTLPGF
ncbi:MAG: DUF5714 domain-containing protein [Thermodesulfobacteriota bacterium]